MGTDRPPAAPDLICAPAAEPAARWGRSLLPAFALALNAFTWGVSWWPFRQIQGLGLHPLWATAVVYTLTVIVITLWRPSAWRHLVRTPALWVLVLAAGTTNASFNWAVTVGDVVRVVLLFYLMPLWAVLLARLVLGERLTPLAGLRVVLALTGAAIVLWPAQGGLPLPRALPEWLAVLGGFSFALNNVMLRRQAGHPRASLALAMFCGGFVVAGVAATLLAGQGVVPWPPAPAWPWALAAAALSLWFLAGNLALQYGAARLSANATAVIMITEVLFASVSAVLLGAGVLSAPLLAGGALIVGAAVLALRA